MTEKGEPTLPIRRKKSEVTARLREVIGDESVTAFARRCGVGESLMRAYLSGSIPTSDKLLAIADAASVSIEWLVAGRGPMLRRDLVAAQAAPAPPPTPAPAPTPAPSAINERHLSLAITAIEDGLGGLRVAPEKKAAMVLAAYKAIELSVAGLPVPDSLVQQLKSAA